MYKQNQQETKIYERSLSMDLVTDFYGRSSRRHFTLSAIPVRYTHSTTTPKSADWRVETHSTAGKATSDPETHSTVGRGEKIGTGDKLARQILGGNLSPPYFPSNQNQKERGQIGSSKTPYYYTTTIWYNPLLRQTTFFSRWVGT